MQPDANWAKVQVTAKTLILLVVAAALVLAPAGQAGNFRYDKRAQALAAILDGNEGRARRGRGPVPTGIEALGGKLGRVLSFMKQSDISNGPAASALVTKAYEMREDFCRSLATACSVNICRQYEAAEMLGLFGSGKTFARKITRGRGTGKEVQFEHLVPATICPEFATSLANVRLVIPEEVRTSDDIDALDIRTLELAKNFRKIAEEQQRYRSFHTKEREVDARRFKSSDYGMGRTKEEHIKVWQELVDKDPTALQNEPYLDINVQKTMTRIGYGENQLTAEIINREQHPTEIAIDFRMIGVDLLRDKTPFVLASTNQVLKLLQLQSREIELAGITQLRTHRGKVIINNRYSGWVLTVRHKDKVISHTGYPNHLVERFRP